jgi:hypothetical protein
MSGLTCVRAAQYVATVLAALLLAYAALSSAPSTQFSDTRDALEVCAASKGVLCDVSGGEAPRVAKLRTLRYRI